jgi:hypothetical protein
MLLLKAGVMTTTEPEPLCIESADEIVALVFQQGGPEAVQEFLAELVADKVLCRDDIEDIAEKLRAARLVNIEFEDLDEVPTRTELELGEVLANPFPGNRRDGRRRLYQQGRITMDDLITRGIDPDTLAFVERSVRTYPKRKRR